MGKGKPRHNYEKRANSGLYLTWRGEGGEWTCSEFDGWCCEAYLIPKNKLTACKGRRHCCVKQEIINSRNRGPGYKGSVQNRQYAESEE